MAAQLTTFRATSAIFYGGPPPPHCPPSKQFFGASFAEGVGLGVGAGFAGAFRVDVGGDHGRPDANDRRHHHEQPNQPAKPQQQKVGI